MAARNRAGCGAATSASAVLVTALSVASSAIAQVPIAEKQAAKVDWPEAMSDTKTAQMNDSTGVQKFRAAVPSSLTDVKLPVLAFGTGPVRAAPRVVARPNSYAATYELPAAKLSIFGTNQVSLIEPTDPLARLSGAGGDGEPTFEPSENSADLDFTKYNVPYVLRIECLNADDPRCTESNFLLDAYKTLIVIGGAQ
jgi:hypothetical protein